MAYLNIARKYRPQTFSDLVGQEAIIQTLRNSILSQRVAPAYLFCGARGIGKTTVARIFAKALRCPNAQDAIPCNNCEDCNKISKSESLDVLEIDGASNNGVDSVRNIRENVVYSASSGFFKIYIIDEVHMLSTSAFNALLKTLEEPPSHVVFIFATTEVQKIPLTILSRCQRFVFRRLSQIQVVERLQSILKAEGFEIPPESLGVLAKHSDGSLRDALSLLDQVLSYFGETLKEKKVTPQEVQGALGLQDAYLATQFLKLIFQKKIPDIFSTLENFYNGGGDFKSLVEACIEELRLYYLLILSREAGQTLSVQDLDLSEIYLSELKKDLDKLNRPQIERMAQIFHKVSNQLGFSAFPKFLVEMAAVKMTELEKLEAIEKAILGQSLLTVDSPEVKEAEAPVSPPSIPRVVASPVVAPPTTPPPVPVADRSGQSWKGFVDQVMKKRPLLGALLSHANFQMTSKDSGKVLHLSFPDGSFFEKQALETRNKKDIHDFLKAYFGETTELIFANAQGGSTSSQSLEQERVATQTQLRKETLENPVVQSAKQLLQAEVIDIVVKE